MKASRQATAPLDRLVAADEARRIDASVRYDIFDRPPGGAFDPIMALAARMRDVRMVTVVVDTDRTWSSRITGWRISTRLAAARACARRPSCST